MNQEEVAELFKYCSPRSVMVYTWYGKLLELYCPFLVQANRNVGGIVKDSRVKVDAVKLSSTGKTVYIIGKRAYHYYNFEILLQPV